MLISISIPVEDYRTRLEMDKTLLLIDLFNPIMKRLKQKFHQEKYYFRYPNENLMESDHLPLNLKLSHLKSLNLELHVRKYVDTPQV